MSKLSRPNTKLAESRPFAGMSRLHPQAAGVDIGAHEIMVCVAGDEATQIVRAFGNYTVDLQAIAAWLDECEIKTVATPAPTAGAVWRALGFIGSRCSRNWSDKGSTVT